MMRWRTSDQVLFDRCLLGVLWVLIIPSLPTFTELYPYQDGEAENDACMGPLRSNAKSTKHEHMLIRLVRCTVNIREFAFPLSQ